MKSTGKITVGHFALDCVQQVAHKVFLYLYLLHLIFNNNNDKIKETLVDLK